MSDVVFGFTDGKAYERRMGRWSRLVGRDFLDWLAVPAGKQWLDIGCGNGAFTEEIVARAAPATVFGIDPSEAQLAYARTRDGIRMAQFRSGDAQDLPYDDDSVDVAVMALVIAFVPDPAKALAEMLRVVRPGGWIAAYMWDLPGGGLPLNPVLAALRLIGMDPPLPPSAEISREGSLRDLWAAAGLQSVSTRVIPIQVAFDDFQDFWESSVVPIGPQARMIADLSDSQKAEMDMRLHEILPVDSAGRIAYASFSNAVVGRVPG